MKEIQAFHDAVNDPETEAAAVKERQKKIIGYLCSYAPVELIRAAGFHPMRLFSSQSEISLAENHLQGYCCSLVRGVLESSLSGRLDFLDGTVFPHTCDSIQRLSDIWRLKKRHGFFADVLMPAKLNSKSAATYMLAVLDRFKRELETVSGVPLTDTALSTAIQDYTAIRQHLAALYRLKSATPGIISGPDLHAVVKGSMIMDVDMLLERLPALVARLSQAVPSPETDLVEKRIIISGSACDAPGIYSLIEDAGGSVVADDLCTGQRWFQGQVPAGPDPLKALAERYLARPVCPAKHKTTVSRADSLINLARTHRASGVIFLLLKFCDPHAFDYPYLKERLEEEGIRTLLIETDDQAINHGQLSTRIETFVHMIA